MSLIFCEFSATFSVCFVTFQNQDVTSDFMGKAEQNVRTTVSAIFVTFKSDIVLIVKKASKVKCVKVRKFVET